MNAKFLKNRSVKGFTIAEVLVVIAILAIIGTIMVITFSNTLRGSNKAQVISAIKQNGQAVLENMDKNIRKANNLICVSSNPPNTIVIDQNGLNIRYRIVLPTAIAGAPAVCIGQDKNGCIIWDNPGKETDLNGKVETNAEFINRICDSADPMTSANILTDADTLTGVSVKKESSKEFFSFSDLAGYKTSVTINFQLGPGAKAPAVTSGQIDPVTFQTTVSLR